MKLYIIGNGFDIAHEIKTSYWNFRCYMERYAEDFLLEFEKLYGFYPFDPDDYHITQKMQKKVIKLREESLYHELWKSFELGLGQPDEGEIQSFCDSAVESLQDLESGPVQIEDTLNECFDEQFRFVEKLQKYLLLWIKQVRLHKAMVKKKELLNNHDDLFLTFNYTPTLERIYHISPSQICHIHGGIPPYCTELPVIGHGNRAEIESRRKMQKECDEVFDEGGASINKAFADFYQRTYKNTDQAMQRNIYFFDRIKGVEEIIVIGHSLGNVDIPYFSEILNRAGIEKMWTIYYHCESEIVDMEQSIRAIGIINYRLAPSSGFWDLG